MRNEKGMRYALVLMVLSIVLTAGCQHGPWKMSAPDVPMSTEEGQLFDKVTLHLGFATNKATIQEADYEKLNSVIELIETYPKASVVVEGHTDNVGSRTDNHTLSHQRADAVKNYIVVHSAIDKSRIKTIGYGESRPVAPNETEADRLLNRRVEILIIPE
jgi:outer membrane protein OmpA-like peptidoglycan-associated protein